VARVARFSACRVFSAIKRSTRSLSQRTTDEIENKKAREGMICLFLQFRRIATDITNKLFSLT